MKEKSKMGFAMELASTASMMRPTKESGFRGKSTERAK
jgi:hypothetical protein